MKLFSKFLSAVLIITVILSMCSIAVFSSGAVVTNWTEPQRYYVKRGEVVTYKVDITADELFENIQAIVKYDPDALEFVSHKYNAETDEEYKIKTRTMFPELLGVICNSSDAGFVKFNATDIEKFDFTEGKTLCELEFVAKTDAITDIDIDILYMTIDSEEGTAYFDDGVQVTEEGITVEKVAMREEHIPVVTLSETSFMYDGKAKTPKVKVICGELLLKEGTDYTVTYSDNINEGVAKATVNYKGSYSSKAATVKEFNIIREASIEPQRFDVAKGDVVNYSVNIVADKPFEDVQAIVKYDSDVLELVSYKYDADTDNEYKVTSKMRFPDIPGVICNTGDMGFVKFNASDVEKFDFTDGGNLCTLQFVVKKDAVTDIILDIVYMTIDANAGEAYFDNSNKVNSDGITIDQGVVKKEYDPVVTLSETEFEYDGEAKTPEVKVVYGELLLKEGIDYAVEYSDNVEAGIAKATVVFSGKYEDEETVLKEFVIRNAFTNDATIFDVKKGEKVTYTVDLTAAQAFENIQAVVKFDSNVLELVGTKYDADNDQEYKVTNRSRIPNLLGAVLNDKDAGFVKFNASDIDRFDFSKGNTLITLEFVAKYDTTCSVVLDIQEMNIDAELGLAYFSDGKPIVTEGITIEKEAEITPFEPVITVTPTRLIFDGKPKTPEVKVVFADLLLHEGYDYSVEYKNNIAVGTATAVIAFCGKYEGEMSQNFEIVSGYVDPVTGIIIDDTLGYGVYCKEIEADDKALADDFNYIGESIAHVYEVYLVDKATGEKVTYHADVTIRIPCTSEEANLYTRFYRYSSNPPLGSIDSAYYDKGYLVYTGYIPGEFYLFEPTADYLLGDANGDGIVNIKDVTVIQKNIALIKTAPMTGLEFVDVNGDGIMNVKDVTVIQKYIAELEISFDVGKVLG